MNTLTIEPDGRIHGTCRRCHRPGLELTYVLNSDKCAFCSRTAEQHPNGQVHYHDLASVCQECRTPQDRDRPV